MMARIEEIACMDRFGAVTWMEEGVGRRIHRERKRCSDSLATFVFFFNMIGYLYIIKLLGAESSYIRGWKYIKRSPKWVRRP